MKTTQQLLLASTLIGSLWACGSKTQNTTDPVANNTNATTVTEAPKPTLAGFSMKSTLGDTLYAGAFNPFHVEYPNLKNLVFEMNTSLVKIAKEDSAQIQDFVLYPTSEAIKDKKVEVTVRDTAAKTSQVFTFPVKRLPATEKAVVSLNQKTAGDISAADFKKLTTIETNFPGVQQRVNCNADKYTVWYQRKGQDPVEIMAMGNELAKTGQVKAAMAAAKKGDTFTLKNIHLQCAGDIAGKIMPDMIFNIK